MRKREREDETKVTMTDVQAAREQSKIAVWFCVNCRNINSYN